METFKVPEELKNLGFRPCTDCSGCKVSDMCKPPLQVVTHACDKCGTTSIPEVFPVPYFPLPFYDGHHWICTKCDEKLYDLLSRLPGGVPEEGFRHDTYEFLYAQIIIDAFFSR